MGRNIAELCFKEGHEIIALIRNRKIKKSHFYFDLTIHYGDITNINSLPDNLDGSEIIIHCAADTNMISQRNHKQEASNITGIKNLIVAAKQANIKKFIHISTANTIAHGNENNPANETIKLAPAKFRLPYINSKILGEEILLHEFITNNFPVLILNPTFILGPNDPNSSSTKLILSALKRKIPLYPTGGKNIVDVRDVAQAAVNAIQQGNVGNNYLLANENLTYKEIFTLACSYANVPPPKHQMPYFLGIIIGFVGTCVELITKKSISVNAKTIRISNENHYYSVDKAKNELGFSVRSAKETIKDTVNWLQNEYISN